MTIQKDIERNETSHLHKFADFAGKRILEIGCGEGRLTWQYAEETHSTVGIDLDADALRVAIINRPADLQNKVYFSRTLSEQLPFSKERFEIALLAWSF
jgi:2-polyprenyl-3-methyl-5-hydroxy-6-metoxy-1,4-benzoquinol methylase